MERPLFAVITAVNVVLLIPILTGTATFSQMGSPVYNWANDARYEQPSGPFGQSIQNSNQLTFPTYSAGYAAEPRDTFYDTTCPYAERIAFEIMRQAVQNDPRIAASLLRLHFHDCFVDGCDGSILLDDTPEFKGEKTAGPNNNSARGFEVIDNIKSQIENTCPGVVSCADILAIAARDGVVLSAGPWWNVVLGRKDSRKASFDAANKNLPPPTADLKTLISMFNNKGLSEEDMVALSGAHTIGLARCVIFRQSLYNHTGKGRPDYTIDTTFLQELQGRCPPNEGDEQLSALDYITTYRFDNIYFGNLKQHRGILPSDRVLYNLQSEASTNGMVDQFSSNQFAFFQSFKRSMIKLGNISPPPGSALEIRRDCRKVN